ncbi:hypothetical protein BGX26_005483, partial [Mortierella sp. AD094]
IKCQSRPGSVTGEQFWHSPDSTLCFLGGGTVRKNILFSTKLGRQEKYVKIYCNVHRRSLTGGGRQVLDGI